MNDLPKYNGLPPLTPHKTATLSDAPETIWTTGNSQTGSWNNTDSKHVPVTAYTRTDISQARIAELEAALEWYAAHVADCRKLGRDGDVARGKLDRDGGSKARAALNVAAVNGKADAT
jgi:hypothetical protein